MKENIKAPRHWPLCGEFTGGRWIPRTNGQLREKCFHLMTSSCAICAECASSYQLYIGLWRVFTIMGSAINDWINKFVFFTLVFKKIRKWKYEFLLKWRLINRYILEMFILHGGPSEAGDCSHPPPKMATAKNASSCKATFDHVIGIGSLRFLACEQVLDIANPWYSNERSSRDSLASQGTRIFQREAGDSMARDRRRRVTHGWEAGDSYFRFNFCELLFRCHTQY